MGFDNRVRSPYDLGNALNHMNVVRLIPNAWF
jgi:hypothetical protein